MQAGVAASMLVGPMLLKTEEYGYEMKCTEDDIYLTAESIEQSTLVDSNVWATFVVPVIGNVEVSIQTAVVVIGNVLITSYHGHAYCGKETVAVGGTAYISYNTDAFSVIAETVLSEVRQMDWLLNPEPDPEYDVDRD
jgi:hypothetical protein